MTALSLRYGVRLSLPWLAVVSAVAIALLMIASPDAGMRAPTLVLPLAMGVHAALLFAPGDEPSLELLLAAPRLPYWILLERLLPMLALHGAVGLAATALIAAKGYVPPAELIIDWLPSALALTGLGLLIAFVTRRAGLSVLVVLLLTGGLLFSVDSLILRFPHVFILHPFLTPGLAYALGIRLGMDGDVLYALNRLTLVLLALAALARTVFGLRDALRVLGLDAHPFQREDT
jgi:hypothetical protein